ncbi:serine/threonine protein kinase [Candidatus Woesearchaeota archaeon]|nr:serine/threonine protein kinase [Candidatus Woesearchaeota archaeon]
MKIGNYKVIRQIGEGGFARTYEAEHLVLGKRACLKQNLSLSDLDAEVLKEEAALLWDVHHHSLPQMKDFFRAPDGSCILVMDFVEGRNLEELVGAKGPLHPEDASWVMQRLLQALHYLHSKGIVHSDVKPQNIIVQPKQHNAVLVDYGLSSFRPSGDTRPLGYTEAWAAPELLLGKPPLPESDLYGAGMALLYALGGDILTKSIPDSVPAPLREFCESLLKYDAKERPRWESVDLVKRLSDIRQEAFGRRHTR